MKKSKILLCVLVAVLFISGCLFYGKKDAAGELLLQNVEALSQNESGKLDCVPLLGVCIMDKVYYGMRLAD